jgi:hypothetical protein
MFPLVMIAAPFLPILSAQTTSTEPVPIALSGTVQSLNGAPKLIESVQNISSRAIQGFAFVTTSRILIPARPFRIRIERATDSRWQAQRLQPVLEVKYLRSAAMARRAIRKSRCSSISQRSKLAGGTARNPPARPGTLKTFVAQNG